MALRPSDFYLGMTAGMTILLAGLLLHASSDAVTARERLARNSLLVRELELTDLSLFTEASYTRHPSMTDMQTPFQDSPSSLEHFPTGSLVRPPSHLLKKHELD